MGEPPVKELTLSIAEWALSHGGDGAHERPGIWSAKTEDIDALGALNVRVNPHREKCDDLGPFTFEVTSDRLIAICVCTPVTGTLAGFSEDALIAHFRGQP